MKINKKLFSNWIYLHRKYILCFTINTAILFLLFWAYSIDTKFIQYFVSITSFVFLLFSLWDLSSFIRKCQDIEGISKTLPIALPITDLVAEEKYQEIITALETQIKDLNNQLNENLKATNDYYTMWTHQIKTPLAAIKLLIQQDEVDKQALKNEVFKVEQYTSMVLGYQRLQNAEKDFCFQEESLDTMTKQAVKNYASIFIYQKTPIEINVISQKIVTDKKWFVFVLEQILSNALKYSPNAPIKIYTENDDLVIEDGGIGISAEDIPLIFERGFTGSTGRIYSGSTGIGLYLSKQILDRLSLSIKVESKVGTGTKISIGTKQFDVFS